MIPLEEAEAWARRVVTDWRRAAKSSREPLIHVDQDILISAVRYAVGRSTWVVRDTMNVVVQHADVLSERVRSVIARDITRALDETAGLTPEDVRDELRRGLAALQPIQG